MAGIDNNTVLYLRGDSFKDLSLNNISIVNQGTTIVDNSINLDSGYFTCNTGFKDINTTKYWTIEWWEYSTGASVGGSFLCNKPFTAGDGGGVIVGYYSNNGFYLGSTAGGWNGFDRTSIKDKVLNIWVHWALVRNGDNFVMYKNGVKYWNGTSSILPYAWDNNRFGIGMWYASGGISFGYKANIKNFRISNIARYTEDFTPPTRPYNSITINKTNQTDTNIEFNIEKLGQETINKVEVLVNGTVSETYSDNYDNINYLIDKELCPIGNNKITIRVTFDDVYTEELSLTHKVTIDELPTSSNLIQVFDRQEVLNNSLKLHLDNFRNVLTSKNVEVSKEDKMGDLIDKVDLLDEYDGGKLWLYRNGNEYIDVTGGLIKGGLNFGTASYLKENSFISFSASSTNSGSGNVHLCTSNIIELSKYSKLCAEYESSDLNTNSSISIVVYSSNNIVTSSSIKIAESYSQKSGRDILTLDISRLSDNYVAFGLNTWGTPQSITGKIYKVWLEK